MNQKKSVKCFTDFFCERFLDLSLSVGTLCGGVD